MTKFSRFSLLPNCEFSKAISPNSSDNSLGESALIQDATVQRAVPITWIGKARHSPALRTPPTCCDPKQYCQFVKPGRSESALGSFCGVSTIAKSSRRGPLPCSALANRGAIFHILQNLMTRFPAMVTNAESQKALIFRRLSRSMVESTWTVASELPTTLDEIKLPLEKKLSI